MDSDGYVDIVMDKYSTPQMRKLFSERNIILTWRKCWIALAEAERELGVKIITKDMIKEMIDNVDNINFEASRSKEKETQHDVVAHIYAYGLVCPKAKSIIHLGATSQFVKCNTDMLLQREALHIIRSKLLKLLSVLDVTINKYASVPTLGYSHYQPAQPLTFGRRFCVYAQDFLMDLQELENTLATIKFRGAKGATGTQDSFMGLFENNQSKIEKLDTLVSKKLGFTNVYPITAQTYSRKQDITISTLLANIAASSKKMATDLRLMSNLNILEEPFTETQVGSSAMPYKRNPMKSERVCSLARKVIDTNADFYHTYTEQWLERTLDDSAIRRIDIPQNFMLTEHILDLLIEIISGIVVYPTIARKLLDKELPFMATERIMMATVTKGADRQKMHEILKEHTYALAKHIKLEGGENDLMQRLASDPRIGLSAKELENILDPKLFIGRSVDQALQFSKKYIKPVIKKG